MATDGRKREATSVWERLDAEKAGAAGLPYDTHGGDAMPVKLSEDEQRAQWSAALAAVAEQRKAEPPKPTQTASSINPYEWDLPSGAADAAAQAKAVRAPAPAEVQRQWAEDLARVRAHAGGQWHGLKSVSLHEDSKKPEGPRQAVVGRQSTAPFALEQDNPAPTLAGSRQPADAQPLERTAVQAQWRQSLEAAHSDHPRFARKSSVGDPCSSSRLPVPHSFHHTNLRSPSAALG